jgi:lipoprotein-anchoring transpeptidase ErfK/SrfK
MRLTRAMVLLVIGTGVAIAVLRVSILSVARLSAFSGCPGGTASGQVDPTRTVAFWNNLPVTPLTALADTLSDEQKQVLGATAEEKWIEVDVKQQTITAHQGDKIFLTSPISSGLWNRTPIGEYHIWYKIRATTMEGGNKLNHTYYYLPNVPYTMFFYNDFGIHGTYWHQNFGQPMSHGCVNAPTPVAEKLFYWADPQLPVGKQAVRSSTENPGTRVVVHN